jgi:hypothetical protein
LNRPAFATTLAAVILALGAHWPQLGGSTAAAQGSAEPTASALIELQEGPATMPSPSPTPKPKRGKSRATPAPSSTPTETPTPTPAPTPTQEPRRRGALRATASPPPDPSSTKPGAAEPLAAPIPTQRPTPRPVAPYQPTIPQSLIDPNVEAILHRPIRQLSAFGWLTGTWRAHNVEQIGDGRQVDLGINTYVFAQTMKGRWIFGADGKASDYFYITYDPFAEHWTLVRLGASPEYGIWVSESGWHANTIEFTSNYSFAIGRQYRRRITIIHKDARTFGIYDEEQLSDGSWTGDDAVELTKQQ